MLETAKSGLPLGRGTQGWELGRRKTFHYHPFLYFGFFFKKVCACITLWSKLLKSWNVHLHRKWQSHYTIPLWGEQGQTPWRQTDGGGQGSMRLSGQGTRASGGQMVNRIKIFSRDNPVGFLRTGHTLLVFLEKAMPSVENPCSVWGHRPQEDRLQQERTFLISHCLLLVLLGQGWTVTTGRPGAYGSLLGCWKGPTDPLLFFFSFENAVSKYGSQFQGNSQHDALEFLLWLLDRVHEDLEGSSRGPGSEKVGHSRNNTLYLIFFFSLEYLLSFSKRDLEVQIPRSLCVLAAAYPGLLPAPFS